MTPKISAMIIDEYIAYMSCELNLAERTVQAYAADLRTWAAYATCGGKHPFVPGDVTPSDMRAWVASLSRQGLSARSIKRKAAAVSGFFRWMLKRKGLEANPMAEVQLARAPKKLPSVIPQAQTLAVLDEELDETDISAVRSRLIVEMLYQTGMRAGELAGLMDNNVDAAAGTLRVVGKRNKERLIPFGPGLSRLIGLYRNLRADSGMAGSSPLFFVGHDGRGITYKTVLHTVHAALDGRVTSPKRSPHVLRHSFATDMLNAGADLNSVKQLLGHESLETTQIYTHISLSELKLNYQLAHPRAQKKGGQYGS